jgi:two-component system, chemotaxis family, CheB/CheR fusion protein
VLRSRPYKTWANKIDGAVLSFQDIDSLKRNLDQSRSFADALIENAREPTLVLNQALRVTAANPAFYKYFQVSPGETENRHLYELGNRHWDVPALRGLLGKIAKSNSRVDDQKMTLNIPQLGARNMILNAQRIEPPGGDQMIVLSIEDVTEKTAQ